MNARTPEGQDTPGRVDPGSVREPVALREQPVILFELKLQSCVVRIVKPRFDAYYDRISIVLSNSAQGEWISEPITRMQFFETDWRRANSCLAILNKYGIDCVALNEAVIRARKTIPLPWRIPTKLAMETAGLATTYDIIESVEETHPGLGILVFASYLMLDASVSIFMNGEKGTGKGTIVRAIQESNAFRDSRHLLLEFDTLKLGSLANKVGMQRGKKLVWLFEDYGSMSEHYKQVFFMVLPKLISQRRFYHDYDLAKGLVIDIEDCDTAVLLGIQPRAFGAMTREQKKWGDFAFDRFLNLVVMNPIRGRYHQDSAPKPRIPTRPDYTPSVETDMSLLEGLLTPQISEGRVLGYCRRILTAFGRVNGLTEVDEVQEQALVRLIRPYLTVYNELVAAKSLESQERMLVGPIRVLAEVARSYRENPVKSREELAEYFKLELAYTKQDDTGEDNRERKIYRAAQPLIAKNFLNSIGDGYTLGEDLRAYFDSVFEVFHPDKG